MYIQILLFQIQTEDKKDGRHLFQHMHPKYMVLNLTVILDPFIVNGVVHLIK